MELHQVRYFLALSETLNFTRAAETCHVTQPALTKAIQRLEAELGGDLLYRERQATRLTPLGERLLPFLAQTYQSAMATKEQAGCFMRQDAAPLRLGLMPLVPLGIMAPVLGEIARCYHQFSVTLVFGATDRLVMEMLDGALDAIVTPSPDRLPDRLHRWPLYRDHLSILCSDGAGAAAIPGQTPLIVPTGCGAELAQLLGPDRMAGFRVAHQVQDGIPVLVAAGLGHGVIASRTVGAMLDGLIATPIDESAYAVTVAALAGRPAGPALDAFLKLCRARAWG